MPVQLVDLDATIIAKRKGPAPIVFHVGVRPIDTMTVNGPVVSALKNEAYVLLSSLPDDIRNRVITAIQALVAGG